MSFPVPLRDASVQEIQLELIRRSGFNDYDGARVYELLTQHQRLWRAVILDRQGFPDHTRHRRLLASGLVKHRDLEDNVWNADTLLVYTPSPEAARELAVHFEAIPGAMPTVHTDYEETNAALGAGREEHGLLTVWWD